MKNVLKKVALSLILVFGFIAFPMTSSYAQEIPKCILVETVMKLNTVPGSKATTYNDPSIVQRLGSLIGEDNFQLRFNSVVVVETTDDIPFVSPTGLYPVIVMLFKDGCSSGDRVFMGYTSLHKILNLNNSGQKA